MDRAKLDVLLSFLIEAFPAEFQSLSNPTDNEILDLALKKLEGKYPGVNGRYYVIQVDIDDDDGKYHHAVGIVWGTTRREAYDKGQNLFSAYDIDSFSIKPLDLEDIMSVRTKGGAVVANFEDYIE